jgi:F-type H+-transporting ATPase subunit b
MVAVAAWFAAGVQARAADEPDQPAVAPSSSAAGSSAAGQHPIAAEADPQAAHGGGHGDHDPYDLSHANAGPMMTNPIEWRYDMTLASFVVFVLLLLLLGRFAWGSIQEGLDRREKAIAARIESAQQSADDAAEQLRLYQAKLAAATHEAQELLARARRDGEASADAIRRAAQDEAARERDRAIADIRAAKNLAVTEIGRHAADLAVKLAGRIVRRELSPQDHTAMIAEALEKLPSQN